MQVWQQVPSSHSALDHCSLSPSAASLPYALCESPSLPWLQHNSLQQMAALQHGCKERTVAHAFISSFTSFLFSSFHFFFLSFLLSFAFCCLFSSLLDCSLFKLLLLQPGSMISGWKTAQPELISLVLDCQHLSSSTL